MKFQVEKDAILRALTIISKIVKGGPIQILQTVRLTCEGNRLEILACNGETWFGRSITCASMRDGSTCIYLSQLRERIAACDTESLEIDTDDTRALVTWGKSVHKILVINPEDFPAVPGVEGEAFTVDWPLIQSGLEKCAAARSTNQYDGVKQATRFDVVNGTLTAVATDSHRLHKVECGPAPDGLPAFTAAPDFSALAACDLEAVDITLGNLYRFEGNGWFMVGSPYAMNYPQWPRVFPAEWSFTFEVDAVALRNEIKDALIVARDDANRVNVFAIEGGLQIYARSEGQGEYIGFVECGGAPADFKTALNGRFALDYLNQVEGLLTVSWNMPSRQFTMEIGGFTLLVMPMAMDVHEARVAA